MKETSLQRKFSELLSTLRAAGSAVLAFSGGVDSSFLLKAMAASGMKMLAVTAGSETMPEKDLTDAFAFAREAGVEHVVIRTEEMENEDFVKNPPDRCFFCKDELFGRLVSLARQRGFAFVFDGSNADDLGDYRPGRRAAEIHGVRSPLAECGFSKGEIRALSKELGLSTWDRPSSPCLSSRIPYGIRITGKTLLRIAKAEELLRSLGFTGLRVRDLGDTARIEVAENEIPLLLDNEKRRLVAGALKSLGYRFVSLDLEGYRSGSLNRALKEPGE